LCISKGRTWRECSSTARRAPPGCRSAPGWRHRDDVELIHLPPERRKDPDARAEALNAADAVILCLPDDAGAGGGLADREPGRARDRRLHRPPHGGGLDLRLPRAARSARGEPAARGG
jgi:hypothetical protein